MQPCRKDTEYWADFKNVVTEIHRQDLGAPAAWPELMATVMQMEQENPRLTNTGYVTDQLTVAFIDQLREQHSPVRYSRDGYRDLITKLVLLHDRPLLAAVSLGVAMDNCPDPTEIIEEQIRFAEVTMGATFTKISAEEQKQRSMDRGLKLIREQGGSIDEDVLRTEFERLSKSAEKLREQHFSLDQLVNFTANEFSARMAERGLQQGAPPSCWEAIDSILSISEEPEFTAVALINSAISSPDPIADLSATKEKAAEWLEERDKMPGAC